MHSALGLNSVLLTTQYATILTIPTQKPKPMETNQSDAKKPKPSTLKELAQHERLFNYSETPQQLHQTKEEWMKMMHEKMHFEKGAGGTEVIHFEKPMTTEELYSVLRKVTVCHLPVVHTKHGDDVQGLSIFKRGGGTSPKLLAVVTSDNITDTEGFGPDYVKDQARAIFNRFYSSEKNKKLLSDIGIPHKAVQVSADSVTS